MHDAFAHMGGLLATRLRDVTTDLGALDGAGWWAVVVSYEGKVTCARFDDVRPAPLPVPAAPWRGPAPGDWTTSLDQAAYEAGVRRIRSYIEQGEVYQANLCRVLTAPLPGPPPYGWPAATPPRTPPRSACPGSPWCPPRPSCTSAATAT